RPCVVTAELRDGVRLDLHPLHLRIRPSIVGPAALFQRGCITPTISRGGRRPLSAALSWQNPDAWATRPLADRGHCGLACGTPARQPPHRGTAVGGHMPLTPVEIRHIKLRRAWLRGYRRQPVEQVLVEIADSFEEVWRERADLSDRLEELEA